MIVLIDVPSIDSLEIALEKSGVENSILGTDKDIIFDSAFGKEDIKQMLDWHLECDFEGKELKFANHLLSETKAYNAFVDQVFHNLGNNFDADCGINNNVIMAEIEDLFSVEAKKFNVHKEIAR